MKNTNMTKRIFFKNAETRDEFFLKLKNRIGTWSAIREELGVARSTLEKYRRGILSLPHEKFKLLLNNFPSKDQTTLISNIEYKNNNWGRSKGGTTTYYRHNNLFKKGRKIGSSTTKYAVDSQLPLTEELAEFIGAFIGDGFTNKYGSVYVVQITGHRQLDFNYLTGRLISLLKRILPQLKPKFYENDNVLRLTVYSKELHQLLSKRFGFPVGKKAGTVTIPNEITNAGWRVINACIRGIFDTDGCVIFDKRTSYREPYIRVHLHMKSHELIQQVRDLLQKQGIKATTTRDTQKLYVNGKKACSIFLRKIGFSNFRHLAKLD